MGSELKADLNIPDLWYDFYARLIPGSLFACSIYYLSHLKFPTAGNLLILLPLGYVCGLFIQPISSFIIGNIHHLAERELNILDDNFVYQVQLELGLESNESRIFSKMHGKVAFFVQSAILSFILFIFIPLLFCHFHAEFFFIFSIVSLYFAFLVSMNRLKRAVKIRKSFLPKILL